MVLLLLSPISFFAQNNPQREHLPKEQNPQIQIKRLTLALNLTDDQANLVESLFEKHRANWPQRPNNPKSLSQEQKEGFQKKRLEAQIYPSERHGNHFESRTVYLVSGYYGKKKKRKNTIKW